MSITVTIGTEVFEYPTAGESPGWGEDATDSFVALTEQLNLLSNINDILETSFSISNNVSSLTTISQLAFNTLTVRSAEIDFSVYRKTDTQEVSESGTITVTYKSIAGSWTLTVLSGGDDTGVEFNITDAGQFQYTSSDLTGTSYVGILKFRAKTLQS